MSAKVHAFAFESPRISGRNRNSDYDTDISQGSTKSPRSPRTRGKLSRQNSEGDINILSRQGSGRYRRGIAISPDDDDNGTDLITDHNGASSRGPHSSRGKSTKRRSKKYSSSSSSKSGKKRVSFTTPLIDPRPEKIPNYLDTSLTYGDNSLTDEEITRLQDNDYSDPTTPRRMRKRRNSSGRWRKYIPFGQYIPTIPSLFCSSKRRKSREVSYY